MNKKNTQKESHEYIALFNNKIHKKEDISKDELKKHLINIFSKLNNILLLSGAGSSKEVGYPTTKDLLSELKSELKNNFPLQNIQTEAENTSLEKILDTITDKELLKKLKTKIIKIINDTILKDESLTTHTQFIKAINSFLTNNNRLKIFTLNYDLCFEKACEQINYIVNDGFFLTNNEYNPMNFQYELVKNHSNNIIDFIPNLIHLYKLHGSLNWIKKESKIYKNQDKNDDPLLILPHENKYKESYNLPYIDMISEFNVSLQKQDSVLVVIGYGFGDEHINNIIRRAFNINNKLHIVIVDPSINLQIKSPNTEHEFYINMSKQYPNITIIRNTFSNFVNNYLASKDILKDEHNFLNKIKDTDE